MSCCKDCNNRIPIPNCHITCELYLNESKKRKEINEKILKDKIETAIIMGNNKQRTIKRSPNDILSTNKVHRRSK